MPAKASELERVARKLGFEKENECRDVAVLRLYKGSG